MKTNVKLIRKETIADGTMAFHFSRPDEFSFRAGQFGDFTLINPSETDSEGDTRGFSLANAPFEPDLVVATRMRDTAFKRVLRDLPIGSEVTMDAPYGEFMLHEDAATPAVFLIGGIGVTPVRSMIAQATHDKAAHRIILLHASRTPADLPLKTDFEQLAKGNPNFTYVTTVEVAPEGWQGERGFVDAAMVKKHVPDLHKPIYYLCGPEGMVGAMWELLEDSGIDEDNIRSEQFTGY